MSWQDDAIAAGDSPRVALYFRSMLPNVALEAIARSVLWALSYVSDSVEVISTDWITGGDGIQRYRVILERR